MGPVDKLRRVVAGKAVVEDAAARKAVADFIEALEHLGAAEGPAAYAHYLDAPIDAEPRWIAYLLIWREGPDWSIWADLNRLDAVDLAIDSLAAGFDAYVAAFPQT